MVIREDLILINHIKLGNPKAFELLFLKYHKKLYYFCFKTLKNKEESEGLVQNIFMEIWANRERIDINRSFYGYLFKIAKNKIYNHLRKSINEQVYKEYIIHRNEGSEYRTEIDIDYNEISNILEEIIGKLPPRRKQIFSLSRNEGLTYKEIGKKLNISENTVDTQIRNALDFIREKIKEFINIDKK